MTSSMGGNKSVMRSVKNPFGSFVKCNIDMVDVTGSLHHTNSRAILTRDAVYELWHHPNPGITNHELQVLETRRCDRVYL
jgi:hypothetical protein